MLNSPGSSTDSYHRCHHKLVSLTEPTVNLNPDREIEQQGHTFHSHVGSPYAIESSAMANKQICQPWRFNTPLNHQQWFNTPTNLIHQQPTNTSAICRQNTPTKLDTHKFDSLLRSEAQFWTSNGSNAIECWLDGSIVKISTQFLLRGNAPQIAIRHRWRSADEHSQRPWVCFAFMRRYMKNICITIIFIIIYKVIY